MRQRSRPLLLFTRILSGLGLLSIHLTGEITVGWLAASWTAWAFSLVSNRFPLWLAGVRRFETLAVAGMVAMLFLDFLILRSTIFIAVTHFLLLFQIVKLLGETTRKDCFQIFLFSFFQILAACTLSVDAWHAAVLLALIPTATALLFWNQMEREFEIVQRPMSEAASPGIDLLKKYRGMAAAMCAMALPLILFLTIAVFIIFPRLTLNASLPGFRGRRSGYEEQVNLAQKGSINQDSSVVLWLSFPKSRDRAAWNGYLRGNVLNNFDGKQWTASKKGGTRSVLPDSNGVFLLGSPKNSSSVLEAIITLADTSANTLFTIGKPLRVLAPLSSLQESEGGSLHWLASWNRPLRYEVFAAPFSDAQPPARAFDLPAIPLERVRALADHIAGNGPPLEQAQRIAEYLQKNYRYSNSFGDRVAENPVDDFLMERKEGGCGHFASAMALMLRLKGIPSRLVAGYLRGEWNEPAESIVVREKDAHAWVEVYSQGQGWTLFDPSPRQAAAATVHITVFHRFAQYWDYIDLLWNRFVIQYDLYSQIKAFENVKGASGRWGTALSGWWSKLQIQFHHARRRSSDPSDTENKGSPAQFPWKRAAGLALLSGVSFFLVRRRRESYYSTLKFYITFLKSMDRAGFPKHDWETGQEFAARLARVKPGQADSSRRITEKYYSIRFRKATP